MRRLIMLLTLAVSFLTISGIATATDPPNCDPKCPWEGFMQSGQANPGTLR
jgi:hypothetical protein